MTSADSISPVNDLPAGPDDLEESVARMARIGSCRAPSFSPDGSRIALISDLSGVPQIWTVASEGGWPEAVTALDDQVEAVSWSPDGQWLAFQLAPGGGLNGQIHLVRPDGTGTRRLTGGGRENNRLGPWSKDGRKLALASSRRSPGALDAWVADVAGGGLRLVAENRGIGGITDISRDGTRAVLSRLVNRGDNNLFLIDLAGDGGRETLLTPHEGPGSFGGGKFAPDGRIVYLWSNGGRDLTAFARVRLDHEGRPGPIEILAEREGAELQDFAIGDDGATAALVWNVAGRSELAFLDLATLAETPGPELPAEVVADLTFSENGRLLAMTLSGAALPTDVWIFDRVTERLRQLTHSPHAGVDLGTLVRPELVRFPAHDGLELTAWLYRSDDAVGAAGPGPVVLSFHGGPEGQERPLFNSTYQALLSRGIAVLAPNVRGSSGFGKRFVNLDNGALRVDAIRDIGACVDYAVGAGVADPGRVGIMGGSYGGYMTMAGLAEYPERFAAGANLFGVVNFATFFAHTEPWMAAISKIEYGDPDAEADLLRDLSPINKIDRVVAPTIVLHGVNDTNVPVVEAEQVVDNLERRDVPVEYILFPDEGHGFRKTRNRITAAVSIVRWFARHLGARGA